MSQPNWRDAGAYGGVRPLDAAGYAWEFLKRIPCSFESCDCCAGSHASAN